MNLLGTSPAILRPRVCVYTHPVYAYLDHSRRAHKSTPVACSNPHDTVRVLFLVGADEETRVKTEFQVGRRTPEGVGTANHRG